MHIAMKQIAEQNGHDQPNFEKFKYQSENW